MPPPPRLGAVTAALAVGNGSDTGQTDSWFELKVCVTALLTTGQSLLSVVYLCGNLGPECIIYAMLLFHRLLMFDPVNQDQAYFPYLTLFSINWKGNPTKSFELIIQRELSRRMFSCRGVDASTGHVGLYMATLGNCFEIDEWDPIEFSIRAKHFGHISDTPLPRAARWNRLNARCIVGSMHQHN
ncbi:hypothetical protein ZEAMMB73_Zm00001d044909 [Zea mays]|uniref:Uncharacterized protein n=1 Tax=Zea mays TaxID=4577 RepID=A0A1D6NS81_MAIZE|nr:hypothetical protein ZEAMMB73_Zm00001d044909 [Zea mays]